MEKRQKSSRKHKVPNLGIKRRKESFASSPFKSLSVAEEELTVWHGQIIRNGEVI
jgi:hypothetical protein